MNRPARCLVAVFTATVACCCAKTDGPIPGLQQPNVSPTDQAAEPRSESPQPAPIPPDKPAAPRSPIIPDTFTYGPPWGPIWCTHNSHIDAEALVSRHTPKGVHFLPGDAECAVGATAKGTNFLGGFTAMCGDEYMDISRRRGLVYSEELGAQMDLQEDERSVSLLLWLSKVPCHIMLRWRAGGGLEANHNSAFALAKDVIAALTPEALKVPRVDVIYTAEDTTGDAARAALERFKDRAATLQSFAPLAPGYPRVARSEEFAGLPAGKQFLLFAICPGGWARTLEGAFGAALPPPYDRAEADIDFKHYTTDGFGLPRACPETGYPDALSIQFAPWKVEGDRLLTAASINSYDVTTPGELRFRAAAFLYTQDGALLDTITVQEPYPASQRTRGRYASEVTKSYGKCKSLMQSGPVPKFTFGCEVEWEDQECSVKPFEGKSYYIKVSDDHQLSIEEIPGTQSGRCKPKGGFPVVEH